jgi:hypothetical protein
MVPHPHAPADVRLPPYSRPLSRRSGRFVEEPLLFHTLVRRALPWRRRLAALLLGGLLLALVDCDATPRELGHSHAPDQAGQAALAEPETPEPPEAGHPTGPCHSYDLAASVERRPQPLASMPAEAAFEVAATTVAEPSPAARPVEPSAPRALTGRSRLTVVCIWRI